MHKELPLVGSPSGGCSREEPTGPTVTRRQLIQLAAVSAGAVAFTGCQPPEAEMAAQSRTLLAEDLVVGHDAWYATACRGCGAGCGAIVRVAAGRAKKLEGNPGHPVNLGRSCARAQAVVQEQYHPDRLTGPLLRTGPRGTGSYISISWDEALARVVGQLRLLRDRGQVTEVALVTRTHGSARARLLTAFAEAYGASWLRLDPLPETPLREATTRVFGTDRLPTFDIANARLLLTFGADFLSTWLSPVHYGAQYGVFRQGRYGADRFEPRAGSGPRGYMVHVEPRFSMTAANADEWIRVRPGHEGMLALSLAQVILSEGLADPAGAVTFGDPGSLAGFVPERVAADTGVPAERIRSLARRFVAEQPSLAFAGGVAGAQSNGTDNLSAILALNLLVDNVGKPGGVVLNPPSTAPGLPPTVRASTLPEWESFAERLRAGRVQMVLIHDANPVHGLPESLGLRAALGQAPLVVSFSSFPDETTALADLILPSHLPLEDWGASMPDPAPGQPVLTIQQPVVRPLYDTRSFWDVLLQMADQLGGPVGEALPWPSFKEMIRATVHDLAERVQAPAGAVAREQFWTGLLQRGGLWDAPGLGAAPTSPAGQSLAASGLRESGAWSAPSFAGDEAAFPFHVIPFAHNVLGDGRLAHLPWLQAAPDPVTTVAWQNWVELNPHVADRYGLREGDVVGVETTVGRIDLPVYVSPAAPPDVLGIPMGWGHEGYGRWAKGRGTNPMAILIPVVDQATGALAYGATRARLIVTGRTARLPKLEGTVPARQIPEEPVLRITRQDSGAEQQPPTTGPAPADPSGVRESPYAWGMVVDLDRCTGCQACVVACQAENNIPINSEQDFLDHRAKAWIRIERYWEGEPPDVKARFLPVLCQHCQNAPCEPVCPVYATMHSSDGLNTQIYNRCVGTRYCANNCPYSVRFFNWGEPDWPVPLNSQLNPDVTVRSKGIMEKCTFCIQRINRVRRTADRLGRPIQDGELQPACAQACPTNTLIFGNWNDPNSRIRTLAEGPRSYRLLEKYGTEPAVVYLKKVDPTLPEEPEAGDHPDDGRPAEASPPAPPLSPPGEQRRAVVSRLLRREVEGRWLGSHG